MDEFRTIAKLWPTGIELDLGTDSNILLGGATFSRHAAQYVTSVTGTQTYQFLLWNTGRHMTNKRSVKWIFSVLGWGIWTATRWYGTPSTGGPPPVPRVRADAFTIAGDVPLVATPIDPSSTYAPGAWPFNGSDHEIGTAAGAASVVPKDPFPITTSSSYDFAGWLQLLWGGDNTSEFVETDTGSPPGSPGFYDHVVGGAFPVAMGASADIIATYGTVNNTITGPDFDRWKDWIYQVVFNLPGRIPRDWGDPVPPDLIRMRMLERAIQATQPGLPSSGDFQSLIEAAPRMSHEELKRAVQSLKTSLDLGKTALSALDAQIKRGGK